MTTTYILKAGDTLNNIAQDLLGDYSQWREIAYLNDLNIYDELPIGQTINIPSKEIIEERLETISINIEQFGNEVDFIINDINQFRDLSSIKTILGNDTNIFENIDLSPLTDKLKASVNVANDWQLIQWIL